MGCIERYALKDMGDGWVLTVPLSCTVKRIWKHLPVGFLLPKASSGRWPLAGNLSCFLAQMHWNSSGTCLKPTSTGDSGTCFNCLVLMLWHLKSISYRLVYGRCIWQTFCCWPLHSLIYLLINSWLRNIPGTAFSSHHMLSRVHGFKLKLINLTFKVSPLWPQPTCSSCLVTHSSHRQTLRNEEALFQSLHIYLVRSSGNCYTPVLLYKL